MNKEYSLNWLINEIDKSLIITLFNKDESIGNYCVSNILSNGLNEIFIKFANVQDLTNFINYSVIRFTDISNKNNFIDIPLRNLLIIYQDSNPIGNNTKKILLNKLEAIVIYNKEIFQEELSIKSYQISNPSCEQLEIMNISHNYINLDMQQKFDALNKINLINYQKNNI